ncbi:MAG: MBL fold metallo-hydrolase RNA specificity domain-containing protein [Christensenellales bacterium]
MAFASNVSRIQQIIKIAGGGAKRCIWRAQPGAHYGNCHGDRLFKNAQGTLLNDKQLDFIEPDQVVIITTGSQNEPLSGLVRISNDEHRTISIRPDDMVILSSSPIPGNEKAVTTMIDRLIQKGVKVVNDRTSEVHVSGHACQEEQKLMMALTKPKFFMPIHGEFHHLRQHAITAEEQGILPEHMVIPRSAV